MPAWLSFELIPTKLLHYILPILPSLAVLTSAMLIFNIKSSSILLSLDKLYLKLISILPALGGIVISIGVLYLAKLFGEGFTISVLIIALIYFLGSIFSGYYLFLRNYINALLLVIFTNLIALNIILIYLPHQLSEIWVTEKIYEQIQEKNIDTSFALLGYSEPSLIYRLGSNTKILTSNEEAIKFILEHNFKYLIIEDSYLEEFKIMAEQNLLSIKLLDNKITGFNYSNGKFINISIIHII